MGILNYFLMGLKSCLCAQHTQTGWKSGIERVWYLHQIIEILCGTRLDKNIPFRLFVSVEGPAEPNINTKVCGGKFMGPGRKPGTGYLSTHCIQFQAARDSS